MTKIESKSDISNFTKTLSKEQKKKYRWQYVKVMVRTGLFTIMFGGAMIESIANGFANGSIVLLALAVLFGKELIEQVLVAKDDVELVKERIVKRSKRNIKQLKKKE